MTSISIPYSISGSRYASSDQDRQTIYKVLAQHQNRMSEIHVGDCRGVDLMVKEWAQTHQIKCLVYPAKWKLHGAKAGPLRNQQLVEASVQLLAFPGPRSKGTYSAINLARRFHFREPVVTPLSS